MEDEYDFRSYHPICVKYGGTVSELIPIKEWFLPVLYILFLQTKVHNRNIHIIYIYFSS